MKLADFGAVREAGSYDGWAVDLFQAADGSLALCPGNLVASAPGMPLAKGTTPACPPALVRVRHGPRRSTQRQMEQRRPLTRCGRSQSVRNDGLIPVRIDKGIIREQDDRSVMAFAWRQLAGALGADRQAVSLLDRDGVELMQLLRDDAAVR